MESGEGVRPGDAGPERQKGRMAVQGEATAGNAGHPLPRRPAQASPPLRGPHPHGKSTLMHHIVVHKMREKAEGRDGDAIVVVTPTPTW